MINDANDGSMVPMTRARSLREPDDANVSRPVLEAERGGDSPCLGYTMSILHHGGASGLQSAISHFITRSVSTKGLDYQTLAGSVFSPKYQL